jgi:MerR family transcriptional regulator, repressor of the yfmOP operon
MTDAQPERELRIGEVAKLAGTTPRTIRYYEEIGLLPPGGRRPGAHRTYAEADVERLTDLLRLKDLLGLALEELKELVEAESARAELRREWHGGVEDPVRRRQILEESLAYTARQLDLVRRRRDEIAELEAELIARRRRVRHLLREAETDAPVGGGGGPPQNTQARP